MTDCVHTLPEACSFPVEPQLTECRPFDEMLLRRKISSSKIRSLDAFELMPTTAESSIWCKDPHSEYDISKDEAKSTIHEVGSYCETGSMLAELLLNSEDLIR